MNKKLKVAMFNVTREEGGAERVIFDLASFMDPAGVEFSFWGSKEFLGYVPGGLAGLEQVEMNISGKTDAGCIIRMARELRKRRIDLVHAHQFRNGFFAGPAGRLAGVPVVYTHHGRDAWRKSFLVDRFSFRMFSSIVAVSDSTGEFLAASRGLKRDEIVVIRNGVDSEKYGSGDREKTRKDLAPADGSFILGVVGRLHRDKGHGVLLAALPEILEVVPEVHVWFAGEGLEEEELRRRVRELGLESVVSFLGRRNDIPDLLAGMDLMVLPSMYEGLPLTVLEAGAAGVPVVATEVDGTVEIVKHGETGLLVPPGDAAALAAAAIDLAGDGEKRKKLAASLRESVLGGHDIRKTAAMYEKVYYKAVEKSGKR